MRIAVLVFDGFNEVDSFVPLNILNRVGREDWQVAIACPDEHVTSMNGVRISAQRPLEFAGEADVVLVGSGPRSPRIVADEALMSRIRLDSRRQLIGAQCSGALLLAKLGLLKGRRVCTDRTTRRLLEEAGFQVPEEPFFCEGNVASAGGCLAALYLASWVIWRLEGWAAAERALGYVVPVGEESRYLGHVRQVVGRFIDVGARASHA